MERLRGLPRGAPQRRAAAPGTRRGAVAPWGRASVERGRDAAGPRATEESTSGAKGEGEVSYEFLK